MTTTTPDEPPRYRVTVPYLTARTGSVGVLFSHRTGKLALGFYKGALLPADVPAEDIERLLAKGCIEEFKETPA